MINRVLPSGIVPADDPSGRRSSEENRWRAWATEQTAVQYELIAARATALVRKIASPDRSARAGSPRRGRRVIASGSADMIRSLLAALTMAGRRVPGPRRAPRRSSAGVTTSRPRFARHATMDPAMGPDVSQAESAGRFPSYAPTVEPGQAVSTRFPVDRLILVGPAIQRLDDHLRDLGGREGGCVDHLGEGPEPGEGGVEV